MRISDWSSDVCSSDQHLRPQHLDMGDDARNLRRARDGDHFVDRGDDADVVIALVPDMADIGGAGKARRGLRELDDLGGVRIFAGNVEGAAGQAKGARSEADTSEFQSVMRLPYA